MAKAVALFTGGTTELRQVAVREDGVCFGRMQTRDSRFGYKWSKWFKTGDTFGPNAAANLDRVEMGFSTLRRARPNDPCVNNAAWFNSKGNLRVRLP